MPKQSTRVKASASTDKLIIDGRPAQNELLQGLPKNDCHGLFSQLSFVELKANDTLQESETPIEYVYFIESGLMSVLSGTSDGKTVEVGLFGKNGFSGLPILSGFSRSPNRIITQVAGSGFRMKSSVLKEALPKCPQVEVKLSRFAYKMALQATQTAACNRLHEVDERLARWLLMSQDRLDSDTVPLTHEFLSHMLGTRRASVTVSLAILARAGLISHSRGHVKIEKRKGLEEAACECYSVIHRYTNGPF